MKILSSQFSDPLENLVCDEVLLDLCDSGAVESALRFWESKDYFVVLGYGNNLEAEVNCAACVQRGTPVFRRCSGGGAVLQGKGCLNYSLVISLTGHAALSTVDRANEFVMQRHRKVMEKLISAPVFVQGHTDLVANDCKFSGNAQRRRKASLLFHGTFLIDFEIPLMDRLLLFPSREPSYRLGRSHSCFTRNLPLRREQVVAALREHWDAEDELDAFDFAAVRSVALARRGERRWCCL